MNEVAEWIWLQIQKNRIQIQTNNAWKFLISYETYIALVRDPMAISFMDLNKKTVFGVPFVRVDSHPDMPDIDLVCSIAIK